MLGEKLKFLTVVTKTCRQSLVTYFWNSCDKSQMVLHVSDYQVLFRKKAKFVL